MPESLASTLAAAGEQSPLSHQKPASTVPAASMAASTCESSAVTTSLPSSRASASASFLVLPVLLSTTIAYVMMIPSYTNEPGSFFHVYYPARHSERWKGTFIPSFNARWG